MVQAVAHGTVPLYCCHIYHHRPAVVPLCCRTCAAVPLCSQHDCTAACRSETPAFRHSLLHPQLPNPQVLDLAVNGVATNFRSLRSAKGVRGPRSRGFVHSFFIMCWVLFSFLSTTLDRVLASVTHWQSLINRNKFLLWQCQSQLLQELRVKQRPTRFGNRMHAPRGTCNTTVIVVGGLPMTQTTLPTIYPRSEWKVVNSPDARVDA